MLPSSEIRLAAIPGPPGLGQCRRRTRRRRVLRVRATCKRISIIEKCIANMDDKNKVPLLMGDTAAIQSDVCFPPKDLLGHSAIPAAVIRHPTTESMLDLPPFPFAAKPPENCDETGIKQRLSLLEDAVQLNASNQSLYAISEECNLKIAKISERVMFLSCALDKYKRLVEKSDSDIKACSQRISYLEDALDLCATNQSVNNLSEKLATLSKDYEKCTTSDAIDSTINVATVAAVNGVIDDIDRLVQEQFSSLSEKIATLSKDVEACATSEVIENTINDATVAAVDGAMDALDRLVQEQVSSIFEQYLPMLTDNVIAEVEPPLEKVIESANRAIEKLYGQNSSQPPSIDIDNNWWKGKLLALENSVSELCEGFMGLDEDFDVKIAQRFLATFPELEKQIQNWTKLELEAFDKKIDSKVFSKLERKIDAKLAPKATEDRCVKRILDTVMKVLDKHLLTTVEQKVKDILSSS